jgi:hypothetical protein
MDELLKCTKQYMLTYVHLAQLQGLNLEPGQPHIDTSIRKEFAEFKAKSAQKSE